MTAQRVKYNGSYLYVNNRKFGTLDVYQADDGNGNGALFTLDEQDIPKPLREGIILRNGLGHTLIYRKWEWE